MVPVLVALLQVAAAAPPAESPPIVVRGVRLATLKDDLDGCVARRCPPRQDIVASVRYAEGLFRTGAYLDAKRVLARAVGRNRDAAAADPLAVSELYLAQATVAMHEGDRDLAREATYRRVEVLRAAMPASSSALLLAEMSVGDMALRTGDTLAAKRLYGDLAARAGGRQPRLAAALALRQANIASAAGLYAQAERLLAPVTAANGEGMAGYRLAARVLAARIARRRGDAQAVDGVLAAIAAEPRQAAPILLWSPPFARPTDPANLDYFQGQDAVHRDGDLFRLGWADIGFWIRGDGTVENAELLRGSRSVGWVPPVVRAIEGRVYAPFGDVAGGQYRVERYTLTADYGTPIGSLIRRRYRNPRIEQIDISTGVPPVAAAGG